MSAIKKQTYEEWKKVFGKLSNTFIRVAKQNCYGGRYTLYDFHTCINGNIWVNMHENVKLDEYGLRCGDCRHKEVFSFSSWNTRGKNLGNKLYTELINNGYKKVGKFEQDIMGRERRIFE